jgi:hypothetical protein
VKFGSGLPSEASQQDEWPCDGAEES